MYIGIDMTPVYAMGVYISYIGIDMIPYIGIISAQNYTFTLLAVQKGFDSA